MSSTTCSSQFKIKDRLLNDRQIKKTDILGLLLANKWYFYSLYIAVDSGKLSFSTTKYFFDIYFANNDLAAKAMREWMRSPQGLVTTVLSASTLIMLALIANSHDKKDKNHPESYVAIFWPYARDSMKGLRNAHRGIQSTFILIQLLEIKDLCHLIVPVSVLLGVCVVGNRSWFRYISSQRTKMMEVNANLLDEIKMAKELSPAQIHELSSRIAVQSMQLRIQLLVSSAFSGTMDGLNPYIGTLTAGFIAPSMMTAITIFCAIYFLTTLTIKINEEMNLQRKLIDQQKEIHSALFEKQMFYFVHKPVEKTMPILFPGIKNGLAGYKYVMLIISTILFLSPVKIKSLEPVSRAILGTAALIMGLVHASILSLKNRGKQQKNELEIEKQSSLNSVNQSCQSVGMPSAETSSVIDGKGGFKKFFNKDNFSSMKNRNSFFAYDNKTTESNPSTLSMITICI